MSNFRTRQAPSPTGYLHLGTARTVLFTVLFSLVNNGNWFLRLEDTDRARLQPEAAINLLEVLYELGLNPSEGVSLYPQSAKQQRDDFYGLYQNGKYAPYIQSNRQSLHHQHAQNLIDRKLAYWSYLDQEARDDLQEIKKVNKKAINYFKASLDDLANKGKTETELYTDVQTALNHIEKPVLRYKMMRDQKLDCYDKLLGKTSFDLTLEEDFVILKSDGFPTYHLAHLVDDYLMKTTLVIRSQEWYASLPKHIVMFKDYWNIHDNSEADPEFMLDGDNGQGVPNYIHVPFILGEVGNSKMSKRDGNVNMQEYIDKGYTQEALLNYLAFLGFNPGTEKELYLSSSDFE